MIYHAHSLYLMYFLQLIHLLLFCVTFSQCAFFQLMPYLSFCTKFYSSTLMMVFLVNFLFCLVRSDKFHYVFSFLLLSITSHVGNSFFYHFSLLIIISNIFHGLSLSFISQVNLHHKILLPP